MPDFYTDGQGRVRPIRGKGGAGAVVAGVAVLGIFVAGGGTGAVSVGAGVGAQAGTAQAGVGSVRLGGSSGQLRTRKIDGQKVARRGQVEGTWQRMGLRQLRRTAKQRAECVAVSFGQVREFFIAHRCTYLERALFVVADEAGNTAVVSVAWVGLNGSGTAHRFRTLIDEHGTGDITPLGGSLLELGGIDFTGLRYGSYRDGAAVTIAEAENTSGGQFDHESLDTIAEVAAYLPRL